MKYLLFLLFLVTVNPIFAQKVTRQMVDSAFRKLDVRFHQKRKVLYVIDGVPLDSLEVENTLNKYDLKKLLKLNYITCEESSLYHCNNDIAVIQFTNKRKGIIKHRKRK